jgi:hypothetical protein
MEEVKEQDKYKTPRFELPYMPVKSLPPIESTLGKDMDHSPKEDLKEMMSKDMQTS